MANYKFGVITSPSDAHKDWLVQSASVTGSAQTAMALNQTGEPVVLHTYQVVDERTLEVIIPLDASDNLPDVPEIGEIVKYGDEAYYITAFSRTETNTDFVRFSITMQRFPHSGEKDEQTGEYAGLPDLSDASSSI